ncbi:MAG: CpsD/CapB family tyrosine-protein kinase [Pseudomonadota bacterium]
MEKLQKAISKARKSRGGAPPNFKAAVSEEGESKTPRPRKQRGAKSYILEGARQKAPPSVWELLTPFEVNPDHLLKNRIMTLNPQASANPFDILRTKVYLMMQENGWTRLAITSPNKGCGKTTTACNLAVGFSRQRELNTMLFDMDLRRPNVATLMGQKPNHSIRDVLNGDVSPQDQMMRLRSNVAMSMARGPMADPTQVMLANSTSKLFDDIQEEFEPDVMIFDLPPVLVTDDARAFLKNVDCALIVARADQTRMNQLDTCEREVGEHTNVLGVMLNNCRHAVDDEEYYGEYS